MKLSKILTNTAFILAPILTLVGLLILIPFIFDLLKSFFSVLLVPVIVGLSTSIIGLVILYSYEQLSKRTLRKEQVFITFPKENEKDMYKLKSYLQDNGFRTRTYRDMTYDPDHFKQLVHEGIDQSQFIVALISKHYRNSKYMVEDMQYANNTQKSIIPVLIANDDDSKEIYERLLENSQISTEIDLTKTYRQESHKLIKIMDSLIVSDAKAQLEI